MAVLKAVNRVQLFSRHAWDCIVFGTAMFLGVGALASPVSGQAAPPWQPIPGGGCIMRLAGGDSSAQGELNAYRVRFPADYQRDSGVHYHLDTRHIVVLAGTIVIGYGDTVDVRNTKSYGPGSSSRSPHARTTSSGSRVRSRHMSKRWALTRPSGSRMPPNTPRKTPRGHQARRAAKESN